MPGVPSSGVVTNIETELTALGVPAVLHATLLLAVDKAGYNVRPAGGGSASIVANSYDAAYWAVEGFPGLAVVGVTLPDTSVVYRLVTAPDIARSRRVPSATIPTTTLADATPASLTAIGVELDILRQPQSLLLTLMQAIDDAGYELVAKASSSAVSAGTPLTATAANVSGFPGLILITVTMPDASELSRVVSDREIAGDTGLGGNVDAGGGGGGGGGISFGTASAIAAQVGGLS